jgi:phage terminase large subunit GpA-like protein
VTASEKHIRFCWSPPSDLPEHLWWEKYIRLDNTSASEGDYSTEFVPMVRWHCRQRANPRVRRIVEMVSAQSTKTQNLINSICHDVAESPMPAMFISADQDQAEEFAKKRLFPALEDCAPTKELLPKERNKRSKRLIQFNSMNLMLRGSNSRAKLQSDPVGRIYCDERREWRKGAIDLVRKRTRTFYNFLEISCGTAGKKDDELHLDFKEGSQTFFHFTCPKCNTSQPIRFGRNESVLHPKPRDRGGFLWDSTEITKPNGQWDFEKMRATVRLQCEGKLPDGSWCEAEFRNHEKLELIRTMHEVDYNPAAQAKIKSAHWWAAYMPWVDWADIAEEFLKAVIAYRRGNIEPMIAFITETLGEPWEERGEKPKDSELLKRCGHNYGQPYDLKNFTLWLPTPNDPAAQVITCDRQGAAGGFLKYLIRQWRPNGDSRLIDYGRCIDNDDLREIQLLRGIPDECVFLESGFQASKVYEACVKFNWKALKGDDVEYFTTYEDGKPRRWPWRQTYVDPSLGKKGQGRVSEIPLIMWSNPTYKNRLLLHIAVGDGPLWLLPDNVSQDYIDEVLAEERRRKEGPRGEDVFFWFKPGGRINDYLDDELMQLVVADAGGVAVVGTIADTAKA